MVPGGTFPPSISQHWDRAKWLTRNSAYGFSYFAMGIPMDAARWHVHKGVNGPTKQLFWATDDAGHFNFYYHGPLGMYKFGWKAWNYWDIDKMDWKHMQEHDEEQELLPKADLDDGSLVYR